MPAFLRIARAIAARIGISLLVLVGVSILIFVIARVIPGDPARIALGPAASAEQVASLRNSLHLNAPLPVQYAIFVKDLFHGDLGMSLYTHRPVMQDLGQFLPATLELIICAGILVVCIGFPLGILAARFRGSWFDQGVRLFSVLTVSAPQFVWAVVLMLALGYFIPLFPIAGRITDTIRIEPHTGFLLIDTLVDGNFAAFGDALWHLVLPAFSLAITSMGQAARLTRANMGETYRRPFIEMAQSFGFPEKRIAGRYAFKVSIVPSLTVIGMDLAAMLGGAFLVESVFAWPGVSKYGVAAILNKDLNAIVGTVLIVAAMFLVMNLVIDLIIAFINPRIRYSQRSE